MSGKTFDADSARLRTAASAIGTEQSLFQGGLADFKAGARELSTAQGYLDSYNDVIQDVLRATEDAIGAFDALVANLGQRVTNLGITADNYQSAHEAAQQRYAGLGGGG